MENQDLTDDELRAQAEYEAAKAKYLSSIESNTGQSSKEEFLRTYTAVIAKMAVEATAEKLGIDLKKTGIKFDLNYWTL